MAINAKIPSPVRDSDAINKAFSTVNTQVNANITAIALNTAARTANTGITKAAAYTVTAGDDTANTKTIATGLTAITAKVVQIMRANVTVTGDAAISVSSGNIIVADGSTYVLTAGDIINWIAVGTVA